MRAQLFVQADERSPADELVTELLVFRRGAITPVHRGRLGAPGNVGNPLPQTLMADPVRRRGNYGHCGSLQKVKSPARLGRRIGIIKAVDSSTRCRASGAGRASAVRINIV